MRKNRILILNENDILNQFCNACIVSLSRADVDNLKLLQQYLPKDLTKKCFTDEEKAVIIKYNNFLDSIKSKNKSSTFQIDFGVKKIELE